jgi:hypothetical protein
MKLPAYKVTYENGTTFITSMAAGTTLTQARAYYVGKSFTQLDEVTSFKVIGVSAVGMVAEPKIGQKIEYNKDNPYGLGEWQDAGEVVAVIGNICYLFNPNLPESAHKSYFGCSPVPKGCEKANDGFIWRFHDTLNTMHRVKE